MFLYCLKTIVTFMCTILTVTIARNIHDMELLLFHLEALRIQNLQITRVETIRIRSWIHPLSAIQWFSVFTVSIDTGAIQYGANCTICTSIATLILTLI
jgi:hypothetical protein